MMPQEFDTIIEMRRNRSKSNRILFWSTIACVLMIFLVMIALPEKYELSGRATGAVGLFVSLTCFAIMIWLENNLIKKSRACGLVCSKCHTTWHDTTRIKAVASTGTCTHCGHQIVEKKSSESEGGIDE
jgi:hypothetical protein